MKQAWLAIYINDKNWYLLHAGFLFHTEFSTAPKLQMDSIFPFKKKIIVA